MVLLSTVSTRGNCTVRGPGDCASDAHSPTVLCLWAPTKTQPLGLGFPDRSELALLRLHHIGGLRPFLAVNDLKLNHITFLQTFVALAGQRAVVHEYVGAILTADKAKAFRIVEPFHGSFQFHFAFLPAAGRRQLQLQAPLLN